MPERIRPDNPFSTRFTRPGALPYLSGNGSPPSEFQTLSRDGDLPSELASRVLEHSRSAIVGPHGTGKSTLLVHLRGHLERISGRPSALATLRIGEPAHGLWAALASVPRGGTMIVDGYEQLTFVDRGRLIYYTGRGGHTGRGEVRLLVTSHRPPWLFHRLAWTGTSRQVARQLTTMLLRDFPEQRRQMLQSFDDHWLAAEGNIRQLWATLYEQFEDQFSSSYR